MEDKNHLYTNISFTEFNSVNDNQHESLTNNEITQIISIINIIKDINHIKKFDFIDYQIGSPFRKDSSQINIQLLFRPKYEWKYTIIKTKDDWYYLKDVLQECYKCDQIEGLMDLLKDLINLYQPIIKESSNNEWMSKKIKHVEYIEFKKNHNLVRFTQEEINIVTEKLEDHYRPSLNFAKPKDGILRYTLESALIKIYKFNDEWFIYKYESDEYIDSEYILCDSMEGLIDILDNIDQDGSIYSIKESNEDEWINKRITCDEAEKFRELHKASEFTQEEKNQIIKHFENDGLVLNTQVTLPLIGVIRKTYYLNVSVYKFDDDWFIFTLEDNRGWDHRVIYLCDTFIGLKNKLDDINKYESPNKHVKYMYDRNGDNPELLLNEFNENEWMDKRLSSLEFMNFKRSHKHIGFSRDEYNIISEYLESDGYQMIDDDLYIGKQKSYGDIRADDGEDSIIYIYKFVDDWYVYKYANEYTDETIFILCDSIDGLVGVLERKHRS